MFSRYDAKQNAKDRLNEQLGSSAGAFLICKIFSYAFALVIPLIGFIVGFPASELAYANYNLKLSRMKKPKVINILEGYDNTITAIFLGVLRIIFILLWDLIGIIILGIGIGICNFTVPLGIIFMILGYAWIVFITIFKSLQYSMCYYALADDPSLRAGEALDRSKAITAGHIGDLFLLELTFIGWYLLTSIFLPTILYFSPYKYATYAYVYNQLVGNTHTGKEHDDIVISSKKQIVGLTGMYKGNNFEISANEEIIIGRDPSLANIVLPEENDKVSRKHCGIVYDEKTNKYGITDYSRHGTFLEDGARVSVGTYMWVNKGTVFYIVDKSNMFRLD